MLMLCDGDLTPVCPIDSCMRWGYEQRANELTTGEMVLPSGDELVRRIRVPGSFVHAWDGDEDMGYFAVSGIASDKHAPRGTITYKLQGAESTLLRGMLSGWHEIGGTDYPTRQVMAYMLARQRKARWTLGECEFTDYYQYNFEDTTILESLLSLGEVLLDPYMFVFDSTVTPWTVHLRRAPTEPRRVLCYRRNMTSLTLSADGRVVTRLYGRGYGEGDNQLTIASVNGGDDCLTSDPYGYGDEWEGVHVDTRQTDPATLKAHMEAILAAGCRPQISYEADVLDLARETGESWDDVRVHDLVLVLDEQLGEPVTVRCTGRKKRDVDGDPGAVTLTLDSARSDTAEELNEIRDKIGVHELYSQGATNMYSMQISDNADDKHPLVMRFYVPGNVLRINSCRISWQIERFRTYATMAASGGASTRTSASAGGATVSLPTKIVTTSASTGGPLAGEGASALYTEANERGLSTESVDGHTHTVQHAHNLNAHTHASFTSGPSPAVTVTVTPTTSRNGGHAHDIESHTHKYSHWHLVTVTVNIPAMTFDLEAHSHTVSIPEHTHELTYGVYEGSRAGSITLVVDGVAVPAEAMGTDRELDVAAYLRKNDDGKVTRGAWHEIEFTPDGITRITADLFFQVFIQSRGAGDY